MYAMVATIMYLAFAVTLVSWFISKLGLMHGIVVKQNMRYLKGIIDTRLHIEGQHINLKGFRMWIGPTMWWTVGLPPNIFYLLEMGPCHGIKNNNKWWHDLQWRRNTWPWTDAWRRSFSIRKLINDVGGVQKEAMTIMCNNQGFFAFAKIPPTMIGQNTSMCNIILQDKKLLKKL